MCLFQHILRAVFTIRYPGAKLPHAWLVNIYSKQLESLLQTQSESNPSSIICDHHTASPKVKGQASGKWFNKLLVTRKPARLTTGRSAAMSYWNVNWERGMEIRNRYMGISPWVKDKVYSNLQIQPQVLFQTDNSSTLTQHHLRHRRHKSCICPAHMSSVVGARAELIPSASQASGIPSNNWVSSQYRGCIIIPQDSCYINPLHSNALTLQTQYWVCCRLQTLTVLSGPSPLSVIQEAAKHKIRPSEFKMAA